MFCLIVDDTEAYDCGGGGGDACTSSFVPASITRSLSPSTSSITTTSSSGSESSSPSSSSASSSSSGSLHSCEQQSRHPINRGRRPRQLESAIAPSMEKEEEQSIAIVEESMTSQKTTVGGEGNIRASLLL